MANNSRPEQFKLTGARVPCSKHVGGSAVGLLRASPAISSRALSIHQQTCAPPDRPPPLPIARRLPSLTYQSVGSDGCTCATRRNPPAARFNARAAVGLQRLCTSCASMRSSGTSKQARRLGRVFERTRRRRLKCPTHPLSAPSACVVRIF